MPLQRVVERDALADQSLAMINEQPQIEFGAPKLRRRQSIQAFAQRRSRDRDRAELPALLDRMSGPNSASTSTTSQMTPIASDGHISDAGPRSSSAALRSGVRGLGRKVAKVIPPPLAQGCPRRPRYIRGARALTATKYGSRPARSPAPTARLTNLAARCPMAR